MSGLVNNDTSALAAGAAVVWLVGRVWPGLPPTRPGEWNWLLLGIALGCGLLLKSSALVLALPIGLALLASLWSSPRPIYRHLWRGLAVGLPALLIAGWWYWRNLQLYGDFTGNAAVAIVSGRVPPAERWVDLPRKLAWLLQGLYGCGPVGPLSLCLPTPIYLTAGGLAVVALLGLVIAVRRRPPDVRQPSAQLWLVHGLTLAATAVAVLVYALSYNNTWGGRFFFPAFLSLALVLSAGVMTWMATTSRPLNPAPPLPDRALTLEANRGADGARDVLEAQLRDPHLSKAPPALLGKGAGGLGLPFALLLLNLSVALYALFFQVLPRYAPPRTAMPFELSRAIPLDARLSEVAEVVGYRLDQQGVTAGGVLAVTVYWRPLAPTPLPYTVFIHIFSPAHGSLAQRDTYPGLGTYPTTGWQPGRVFADTYRLRLSEAAITPDDAYLVLGLYDERTGARLPVSGRDAVAAESWIAFGQVSIQPR
jgi:hypothetical protein